MYVQQQFKYVTFNNPKKERNIAHLRFLIVNLWINFLTNVADLQVGSSVWYNVIPLWLVFERMNYYNFN